MKELTDCEPVRKCTWHDEDEECDCGKGIPQYPALHITELAKRDGWICSYCYEPTRAKAIREHVVPHSRGGSNRLENLVLACGRCNSRKMHLSIDEWLMYEQKRGRLHELPGLKTIAAEFYRVRRTKGSSEDPVEVTDAIDTWLEKIEKHWDEQQARIKRGWSWHAFAP